MTDEPITLPLAHVHGIRSHSWRWKVTLAKYHYRKVCMQSMQPHFQAPRPDLSNTVHVKKVGIQFWVTLQFKTIGRAYRCMYRQRPVDSCHSTVLLKLHISYGSTMMSLTWFWVQALPLFFTLKRSGAYQNKASISVLTMSNVTAYIILSSQTRVTTSLRLNLLHKSTEVSIEMSTQLMRI